MLQITTQAVQEFKRVLAQQGKGRKAVRIFTMGSGCCGPAVGMDLVDQGEPADVTIDQEGLMIYLEKKASDALDGATIDFGGEGTQKGFLVQRPAGGTCCG